MIDQSLVLKPSLDYSMHLVIRQPGSAITHFIACILAFSGLPLLLSKSNSLASFLSFGIFMLSMVGLYAASTVYHSVTTDEKKLKVYKKWDHCMIFILIAGSYTPICTLVLGGYAGIRLLILVWLVALLGVITKVLWVTCPKAFSSVIYIAMGWLCLLQFPAIYHALPPMGFVWLLAGGIIYTLGGILYALKLPIFNMLHPQFGSHEIFHLFVMGGSLCHFILMYYFVAG